MGKADIRLFTVLAPAQLLGRMFFKPAQPLAD